MILSKQDELLLNAYVESSTRSRLRVSRSASRANPHSMSRLKPVARSVPRFALTWARMCRRTIFAAASLGD